METPAAAVETEALVRPARGQAVVANRGDGTISVIDARTHEVSTFALPGGGEPMYVVHTPAQHRVFVGDRANDRVVAFDARTFEVEGTVPTGAGVFHMWADPQSRQLWVNADVDRVVTVIDPKRLEVIATVPMPADLVAGCKPHDVVLGPKGRFAYVSLICDGTPDYVVQFSTSTFEEEARAEVGEDPHVSLARQHDMLYVPAQGSDVVHVLNRSTLEPAADPIAAAGAHGAGMARNGKVFYSTNLPGGGTDGVYAIDTRSNTLIGAADTDFPVPHNLALTPDARKLFVTHSGATSDDVSICTMSRRNPVPTCDESVTVGLNPFGLAFVP